jgi:alkylhydroperoxidase family enzyme
MTTIHRLIVTAILSLNFHAIALASEPDEPKPIPQSRRSMLDALDKLKSRSARLPLPEVQSLGDQSDQPRSLGVVNNGRMRSLYLPEELSRRTTSTGQASVNSDAAYQFATELFWIVSRVNNCHYCLGHQEDKLLKVGVPESSLLKLDTDWSAFSAKHQAALAFAKKLTQQPHQIGQADIDALQVHYPADEILEIAFLIGRYNATNRWTDSLGIPQESHRQFESTLGQSALDLPSIVASAKMTERPALADFQQWKERLMKETQNSKLRSGLGLSDNSMDSVLDKLLATNKAAGQGWCDQVRAARSVGSLDSILKDKIAFVAALEDHAWDMQEYALHQLAANNIDAKTAFSLRANAKAAERADATSAALEFVAKLTSHPQAMTDQDVKNLEPYFSSNEIAEIVYHTGLAAMLNRLTLVANLAL